MYIYEISSAYIPHFLRVTLAYLDSQTFEISYMHSYFGRFGLST